jgi:hypothetical protein
MFKTRRQRRQLLKERGIPTGEIAQVRREWWKNSQPGGVGYEKVEKGRRQGREGRQVGILTAELLNGGR